MLSGVIRSNSLHKKKQLEYNMAQIYVDDIFFSATSHRLVDHFVHHMSLEFEMSLVAKLTYFLGLQAKNMNNGTFIFPTKYTKILVKKFGLDFATHRRSPIGTHEKISHDEGEKPIDQTLYRSMIGSLLYLTTSQLDLCYSMGFYAQYQACPKESHFTIFKKFIKYVNGMKKFKLWYSHDSTANLISYYDADWAGNSNDRKSTLSECFYLNNNLVSWFSSRAAYPSSW